MPPSDRSIEERNRPTGTARTLRILSILSWVPTFALLLAYGVVTSQAFPTVVIIPASFSALTAIVHLRGWNRSPGADFLVDFICGSLHIALLIPGWVTIAEGRYWWGNRSGLAMLAAYGTTGAMLDFVVHCYFVSCNTRGFLDLRRLRWTTCPHCNESLIASTRSGGYQRVGRGERDCTPDHSDSDKESMQQVPPMARNIFDDADNVERGESSETPRPSTDDETARLV